MTAGRQLQLEDITKTLLADRGGRSYATFRATLRTAWLVVARDLLLAYLMLATSGALVVAAVSAWGELRILWVVIGCLLIGFWMANLQLFLHEAAHFNIHPDRRWNDRLANALIGVWVGTDIGEYRLIHWDHHRFLGQPTDTERSYFSALRWRFLLESLFFVSAVRVIANRRAKLRDTSAASRNVGAGGAPMLVVGALVQLLVLGICVWQRQYELALAWLAGNLMVYPLFGALRQLLEHRDAAAVAEVDYSVVPHGKLTRSFKPGPFGSFFGGAGFRLHDIHHFDPELSYTSLPRVDAFLRQCPAAAPARAERRSYFCVAVELWQR